MRCPHGLSSVAIETDQVAVGKPPCIRYGSKADTRS
jgi:hypothetical protein